MVSSLSGASPRATGCATAAATPIYLSDPAISVRVSPWAYGPSTGVWQILTFCDVCGRHQRAA